MPGIEQEIELSIRDINRDLHDLRELRKTRSMFPQAQKKILDSDLKALEADRSRAKHAEELLKVLAAYEADLRKEIDIYDQNGKAGSGSWRILSNKEAIGISS